jgi:HAD superfamily phosphatase
MPYGIEGLSSTKCTIPPFINLELNMDILIFDMDGVLIDVSNSYRKTIQQTIRIYLEDCIGIKGNLATDEEISLFKSVGGFNNDWDLTSGLLLYLLSISGIPPLPRRKKFSSNEQIVPYLQEISFRFLQKTPIQIKRKSLRAFWGKVVASGGGLRGVRQALKNSWEGWVYRSGDLSGENLVKRIFQEIYLGEKFTPYYHLPRLFYRGKGYYFREKPLIPKDILAALRKNIRMGIASGRPRFEAELALRRFRLLPYFDSIITLDECKKEELRILHSTGKKVKLSKPHPYSILRAIQEIGMLNPQCGYVGDVVDDMVAAKAAKKELSILAIGFLSGHRNRKIMKKSLLHAGADLIIEKPRELLRLLNHQISLQGSFHP